MDCPTAGLGRRLAALLYDAFLIAAIWMLLGYVVQLFFGPDSVQVIEGQVVTDPVQDFLIFTLMIGSSFCFYAYFWMQTGQTLGMIAWRIKVVSSTGQLISLRQALARYALAWPSFAALGLGYLWLYIEANGDAFHDRYSTTRVIVVPREHRPF